MLEIDNKQVFTDHLFLINTFSMHFKPTIKGIISVVV